MPQSARNISELLNNEEISQEQLQIMLNKHRGLILQQVERFKGKFNHVDLNEVS